MSANRDLGCWAPVFNLDHRRSIPMKHNQINRMIFTARRISYWRSAVAFAAGCILTGLLLGLGLIGNTHGAELRIEATSKRDGITRTRTEKLATWNQCVAASYTIRAQVVTARTLRTFCDGRRV